MPGPRQYPYTATAEVAQLVEHLLAKEKVAGSNPVFRSHTTRANAWVFLFLLLVRPSPGGEVRRLLAIQERPWSHTGSLPVSADIGEITTDIGCIRAKVFHSSRPY